MKIKYIIFGIVLLLGTAIAVNKINAQQSQYSSPARGGKEVPAEARQYSEIIQAKSDRFQDIENEIAEMRELVNAAEEEQRILVETATSLRHILCADYKLQYVNGEYGSAGNIVDATDDCFQFFK